MRRTTNDDRLLGYRPQLFALAERTSVAEACRTFGVHRSTYYAWRRGVERHGLEILTPRERRRPKMPNALPAMVEERVLSFAIAHPGLGPRRWPPSSVARSGARSRSPTRRCGASCAATGSRAGGSASRSWPATAPPKAAPRARGRAPRRGAAARGARGHGLLFVGRLAGTEGAVWQLIATDVHSAFAWAEVVAAQTAGCLPCPLVRTLSSFGGGDELPTGAPRRTRRGAQDATSRGPLHAPFSRISQSCLGARRITIAFENR